MKGKFGKDKILHLLACAIAAILASVIMGGVGSSYLQAWLCGVMVGVATGLGKEYGDHCATGNKWDWYDIIADVIGAIVGASLGAIISII